jgi:zinc transport system substrate-binding protein
MWSVSMKLRSALLCLPFAIPLFAIPALAEVKVVASIKPVHSLVAAVMQGVGEPSLIVGGAGSPHNFSLKPSQAAELQDADLVFWMGEGLEAFLDKPLRTLGAGAKTVELIETPGLHTLKFREGGAFEAHDDEEDEAHDEIDMHVWLDPVNAKVLAKAIEEALAAADPDNAATYRANATALDAKLDALVTDISGELETVRDKRFVVFHDGYHYFENRFGVTAAGSLTVTPDVMPGAERVAEIQGTIARLGVTCVFSEPQFEPRLIAIVTEGTGARLGELDPLGASLGPGPGLYFELLRAMAASIRTCLSGEN